MNKVPSSMYIAELSFLHDSYEPTAIHRRFVAQNKALLLEEINANFITNDSNRALTEMDIDRVMQNNPLELCMLKPIDPNVIAENPNLDMLFLNIEQIPVILESA